MVRLTDRPNVSVDVKQQNNNNNNNDKHVNQPKAFNQKVDSVTLHLNGSLPYFMSKIISIRL